MPSSAGLIRLENEHLTSVLQNELQRRGFELTEINHPQKDWAPKIQFMKKHNIIVCISIPECFSDPSEKSYDDVVTATREILDIQNCHLIIPAIGQGMTELHYTTIYRCFAGPPLIIDSKLGSPEVFFSQRPGFLTKLWNMLKGFFISIDNVPLQRKATIPSAHTKNVDYLALGTQSLLDGYSCGFHTIAHTLAIVNFLENFQDINAVNLTEHLKHNNPILSVIPLVNFECNNVYIETNWSSFIIAAFRKTFFNGDYAELLPLNNLLTAEWPSQGNRWAKAKYIVSYPVKAIINLVKLVTEFPLSCITETLSYLINRLWIGGDSRRNIPLKSSDQEVRSVYLGFISLLYAAFSIPRAVVRMVTSPINSYHEARSINPVLGYLNALGSIVAYSALILFTLPLGLPAAITAGVAMVAKAMSLSMATGAAATSLITVSTISFALWSVINFVSKKIFKTTPAKPKNTQIKEHSSSDHPSFNSSYTKMKDDPRLINASGKEVVDEFADSKPINFDTRPASVLAPREHQPLSAENIPTEPSILKC